MAAPAITTIKRFNYRGDPNEEFSNTYHMTTAPTDDTFQDLVADVVNAEAKVLLTEVTIIRAYGYDDSDHPAKWSWDFTVNPTDLVPGLFPPTGATVGPGDTAYWIRWDTGRKNKRGKAIYLRKYFHPALLEPSLPDTIHPNLKTALLDFGNNMTAPLPNGFQLAGPDGIAPPGPVEASEFYTTRTLKRRGKRP